MKLKNVLSGQDLIDNYKLPRIGPVTIANCFFYLSLLEQFEELEKKFKDHLDLFYARAEKRYEIWYQASARRKNNDPIIPPIDVCYMLHTHMLQPHRFYEDSIRLDSQIFQFSMPLKELVIYIYIYIYYFFFFSITLYIYIYIINHFKSYFI